MYSRMATKLLFSRASETNVIMLGPQVKSQDRDLIWEGRKNEIMDSVCLTQSISQ